MSSSFAKPNIHPPTFLLLTPPNAAIAGRVVTNPSRDRISPIREERAELTARATKELLQTSVMSGIVRLFQQETLIEEIYSQDIKTGLFIWVFTAEDTYNDELMRRMIGYEWQIKRSTNVSVEFEFVPLALCENPVDVIGDMASLLYKKA